MDPIKKEKHRAMRKYKRTRLVQNLFQYCLTAYVFGLFLSKAFPSLFWALQYFICVSLPNIGASLVGPKCLFIVCNMIVIFLVHESNLLRSPSPTSEIHDEFVKFSRRARRPSTIEEKEERKLEVSSVEESVEMIGEVVEEDKKDKEEEQELEEEKEEERKEEAEQEEEEEAQEEQEGEAEQEEEEAQEEQEEEAEEDKGGVDVGGNEEHELPADVLNRKFEDFIQRVIKQRRLEVQMMECGG